MWFRKRSRTALLLISALCVITAVFFWGNPGGDCLIRGWEPGRILPKELSIELLIDSDAFITRLEDDIANAREQIFIQTMSFEGDAAGKRLADALKASSAPDIRLLVDDYSRYVVNDKFKYFPKYWGDREIEEELEKTSALLSELNASGIRVRVTNPNDPLLIRFIARNHKKMMLVDRKIAYLGGINFSDHNFAWHDMMVRIESDKVTDFLKRDFSATWNGTNLCTEGDFGGLWVAILDGNNNEAGFAPVIRAVETARHSIVIESAYISFPFFSHLRDAHDRGVHIVFVTPEVNNKPIMKDYVLWEAIKEGFDVRLYPDRMNHLKAILIDDSILIFGSSNFDYVSRAIQQEILACITDQDVISQFIERVLTPDLKKSEAYSAPISRWKGWPRFALIKGMGIVFSGLNRMLDKTVGSTGSVAWEEK